jgi:hypothetical protein
MALIGKPTYLGDRLISKVLAFSDLRRDQCGFGGWPKVIYGVLKKALRLSWSPHETAKIGRSAAS